MVDRLAGEVRVPRGLRGAAACPLPARESVGHRTPHRATRRRPLAREERTRNKLRNLEGGLAVGPGQDAELKPRAEHIIFRP